MKNFRFVRLFSFALLSGLLAFRADFLNLWISSADSPSPHQAKTEMVLPLSSMMVSAAETPLESSSMARSRVLANPHAVPASLLDFTVVVSGKMKEAKKDFVYAEALFAEFRLCAVAETDEAQSMVLKVYCLANAKRLVSWYPDLKDRWLVLSRRVGAQLMELVTLTQG